MEITERYWPFMAQHPNVGTSLSEAELYRAHFKSILYDPAKVLIKHYGRNNLANIQINTLQHLHY